MRLAKLIGKIYEDYGSVTNFCNSAKIDYGYMSRLLNGKTDIKKSTVVRMTKLLLINPAEIGLYFFPECCASAEMSDNGE